MLLWRLLRAGFVAPFTYLRLWFTLYLISLVSGLLLLILPFVQLLNVSTLTTLTDMADGMDGWVLTELLTAAQVNETLIIGGNQAGLPPLNLTLLVLFAAILLLTFIASAFFKGGVLSVVASDSGFWRGCRRWFWTFIGLQSINLIVSLLLIGLGIGLSLLGGWLTLGGLIVLVPLFLLWFIITELAGSAAIVYDTRRVFKSLHLAYQACAQRFGTTVVLYLCLIFLAIGLQFLFRNQVSPRLPLSNWLLVLIIHQLFILARLGLRLMRFAAGVALITNHAAIDPLAD